MSLKQTKDKEPGTKCNKQNSIRGIKINPPRDVRGAVASLKQK